MISMSKVREYTNKENFGFYQGIGIETFLDHAKRSGMELCPDMKLCWDELKDKDSVLEIGAGYGRCVKFLLDKGFKGAIYALEQSDALLGYLRNHFAAENVTPIENDLQHYAPPQKIGAALWMWSGILDFSPEEQARMVKHIYNMLENDGVLVVETPKMGIKTFGDHDDPQHLHVDAPYGRLDCYIPTADEMRQYSNSAGFSSFEQKDYKTSTEKERSLFILKK